MWHNLWCALMHTKHHVWVIRRQFHCSKCGEWHVK